MPRAEAGTTKAIANKIKAKGLGRLRWYCQACSRQMRDENGFKCHVQSESHVRQVLLIGENPKRHIEDFSRQFLGNFLKILRTTHGEKKVHINQFYQQVITDKEHIHMNATKWKSLTQFAGFLGREGYCRVEETEKGIFIGWIDRSPETMRKREAILKKERQDKGDEEREQQQIQEQVERAHRSARETSAQKVDGPEVGILERKEGERVKLNLEFAPKPAADGKSEHPEAKVDADSIGTAASDAIPSAASSEPAPQSPKLSVSLGDKKRKNVFAAAAKKNPLAGKKVAILEAPKKMSEQERIMKAEMAAMERKRMRSDPGLSDAKRPKVS